MIADLAKDLNKEGWLDTHTGSIHVKVVVKDIRLVYGRKQYHVAPLDGQGEAWVDEQKVKLVA